MSSLDHVAFMARPVGPAPTTQPGAPAPTATLPPLGSVPSKPSVDLLHSAPRAELAPEPAHKLPQTSPTDISEPKVNSEPKPSESKPVSESKPAGLGASLPPISSLDAPAQPPKEPAATPATNAPGLSKPVEAVAPAPESVTGLSAPGLGKPVEAVAPAPDSVTGLSAPAFPKPVEVKSVPQTPINDRTPAGGTPRPELDISQEPVQAPVPPVQAPVPPVQTLSKPATSAPTLAEPKPESSLNGAKEPAPTPAPTPALGQKRKLEDEADKPEQAEKKTKLDEPKPASNGAPAAEAPPAPKKAGRPKKKTPAPVGQTKRKTRSQGPVEGAL